MSGRAAARVFPCKRPPVLPAPRRSETTRLPKVASALDHRAVYHSAHEAPAHAAVGRARYADGLVRCAQVCPRHVHIAQLIGSDDDLFGGCARRIGLERPDTGQRGCAGVEIEAGRSRPVRARWCACRARRDARRRLPLVAMTGSSPLSAPAPELTCRGVVSQLVPPFFEYDTRTLRVGLNALPAMSLHTTASQSFVPESAFATHAGRRVAVDGAVRGERRVDLHQPAPGRVRGKRGHRVDAPDGIVEEGRTRRRPCRCAGRRSAPPPRWSCWRWGSRSLPRYCPHRTTTRP